MMKNFHSNELYEDIKAQVTMTQVLERYGFQIRKHLCICPFHNDRKPSLHIYKGSFYCFACGIGGDVIKFVALYLGVSNYEAAKVLALDYGIITSEPVNTVSYAKIVKQNNRKEKAQSLETWINKTKGLLCDYHRQLYTKLNNETGREITDDLMYTVQELNKTCELLDELDTDDVQRLYEFRKIYNKEVKNIEHRIHR